MSTATKSIVTAVKKHKGPIFVEVSLNNDMLLVQVAKSELLFRLGRIEDGEAGFRITNHGDFIFGRGYGDEEAQS